MNTVKFLIWAYLLHSSIDGLLGYKFIIQNATVTMSDNPYVDLLSIEIHEPRDTVSVQANFIKEPPPDLLFVNVVKVNGVAIPEMSKELCDMFSDKTFAPEVLACGKPEAEFPKACPIRPGKYEIDRYRFRDEKLPLGIPDCSINSIIIVHPADDPDNIFLVIEINSELSNDFPIGGGKFG